MNCKLCDSIMDLTTSIWNLTCQSCKKYMASFVDVRYVPENGLVREYIVAGDYIGRFAVQKKELTIIHNRKAVLVENMEELTPKLAKYWLQRLKKFNCFN